MPQSFEKTELGVSRRNVIFFFAESYAEICGNRLRRGLIRVLPLFAERDGDSRRRIFARNEKVYACVGGLIFKRVEKVGFVVYKSRRIAVVGIAYS